MTRGFFWRAATAAWTSLRDLRGGDRQSPSHFQLVSLWHFETGAM